MGPTWEDNCEAQGTRYVNALMSTTFVWLRALPLQASIKSRTSRAAAYLNDLLATEPMSGPESIQPPMSARTEVLRLFKRLRPWERVCVDSFFFGREGDNVTSELNRSYMVVAC